MFTGLIEENGILIDRMKEGTSLRLHFKADRVLADLKIDDSIAIDGCCQTVVSRTAVSFEVVAVAETLEKTTLGSLKIGDAVNLERAMLLTTRLGGHLVSGHIDGTSTLTGRKDLGGSEEFFFELPAELGKYVITHGSIALAGISLTVAVVERNSDGSARIKVAIIPHTLANTTLGALRPGDKVNCEVDMIAKWVERFARPNSTGPYSLSPDPIIQRSEQNL